MNRWIMLTALLADIDPLAGGSGWAGAGLLGLVLAWLLLKHLPAKDEQYQKIIEDKNEEIEQLISTKDDQMKHLTAAFSASLDKVVRHCEEESDRRNAMFEKIIEVLISSGVVDPERAKMVASVIAKRKAQYQPGDGKKDKEQQ